MIPTRGIDALNQLRDGLLQVESSEFLSKTRARITSELVELIEVGARIRPLLVGTKRVGWVRGVFPSERRVLSRWLDDDLDLYGEIISLGTTLAREEIRSLRMPEMRSLARVVSAMSESDARLFNYLPPFASSSQSEQLWAARGRTLTDFEDRSVRLPDGTCMHISRPSDHSAFWAWLAEDRIQAKSQLSAYRNACLIVQSHVGKHAESLVSDMKLRSRALATDSVDPWREAAPLVIERDYNDGWAHSEDDSKEGLMRELKGMLADDRHERTMQAFEKQQRERAAAKEEAQRSTSRSLYEKLLDVPQTFTVLTPEDIAALTQQSPPKIYPRVAEDQRSGLEKLSDYE
jgi:hypothetical protein